MASVLFMRSKRLRSLGQLICVVAEISALCGGTLIAQSSISLASQVATARKKIKFDFGPGIVAPGYVQILDTTIYKKEFGYGFEPGSKVSCIDRGSRDALRGDFCTSDQPFFFSVGLPEGNYNVTITFGDRIGETNTTVKAELRRLMLEEVHTRQGKFATQTFTVNLRNPKIAGDSEVRLKDREKTSEAWAWDEKLTLEFNNKRPTVCGIEIEEATYVPTVYLLGDSTVCDQPREPYNSWGQMLTSFFRAGIAVANNAESGESLKSSLGARRLDKVLSLMKPGDYLFIQFGHHGDYPEAVRQVAREEKVALIDLNATSKLFYEALGPEKSKLAFAPGDGTHHNNYGSYELARCIVEGIKADKLGLAKYLEKGAGPFDPSHPDSLESFRIPASPLVTEAKPLGS